MARRAGERRAALCGALAAWCLWGGAWPGRAATPEVAPELAEARVEMVQIDAIVTDPAGTPVTGLDADDFDVIDGRRSPEIERFAYLPPLPDASPSVTPAWWPRDIAADDLRSTTVIVVDDLALTEAAAEMVRAGASYFATWIMRAGDLAAVIPMRDGPAIGTRLTAVPSRVQAEGLSVVPGRVTSGLSWYDRLDARGALSVLRQLVGLLSEVPPPAKDDPMLIGLAHLRLVIEELGAVPGRKAVVLVTEGQTHGVGDAEAWERSGRALVRLIGDVARRHEVVVYAVGLAPAPGWDVSEAHRSILEGLARETGGLCWPRVDRLDQALDQVRADQRPGRYLLGFRPADEEPDVLAYHPVAVRVRRPGVRVRSRRGFYARFQEPTPDTDEPFGAAPTSRALARALRSPLVERGIGLRMRPIILYDGYGRGRLKVVLNVDARDLPLDDGAGGLQEVELAGEALCMLPDGVERRHERSVFRIVRRSGDSERLRRDGIPLEIEMGRLTPGDYLVRVAVRDETTGRMGSAGAWVNVGEIDPLRARVSSLLLGRASARIVARDDTSWLRFQPGDLVGWGLWAGGLKPSLVLAQVCLLSEGVEVDLTPAAAVSWTKVEKDLLLEGSYALPLDLPPGEYALEVTLTQPRAQGALVEMARFAVEAGAEGDPGAPSGAGLIAPALAAAEHRGPVD